MSKVINNLRAVIDTLRAVPDEQFNMNYWWLEDGMAFDDYRNVMRKVSDGPCGCAVGHLIQKGLLEKDVLNVRSGEWGPYTESERRSITFQQISRGLGFDNYETTRWLFDQHAYSVHPITKSHVIRRIEFIISELEQKKQC